MRRRRERRVEFDGVRLGDGSSRCVIHGGFQVLHQRAAAPDIERLEAIADSEQGLIQIRSILQQQLVDGFARRVGGGAIRVGFFAVFLRINIGGAAWQQHAFAGGHQLRHLRGRIAQRHFHRFTTGEFDRARILGPRSLAVFADPQNWVPE